MYVILLEDAEVMCVPSPDKVSFKLAINSPVLGHSPVITPGHVTVMLRDDRMSQ